MESLPETRNARISALIAAALVCVLVVAVLAYRRAAQTRIREYFLDQQGAQSTVADDAKLEYALTPGYKLAVTALCASTAFMLLTVWTTRKSTSSIMDERERLHESEARYRLALEHSGVMIWDYDIASRTVTHAESAAANDGLRERVLNDVPESLISSGAVHSESVQAFRDMYESLERGAASVEGVFRIRREDGRGWRYKHIRYIRVAGNSGRAVGMSEDVTAQHDDRCRMDALSFAAQCDSMTGLFNHDATFDHIKRFLCVDGSPDEHALFMIDIDNFKHVNDTLGHQYGDAAIKRSADTIKGVFRTSDIIGRVGGDEFMVLMKRAGDMKLVRKKADELVEGLRIHFGEGERVSTISASVGVAIYSGDGQSFEKLYSRADAALYAAKNGGKNAYRIYGEAL